MTRRSTLQGVSMAELFRAEVESEGKVLSDALLALEREPLSAASVEELMRAAHSIKGAARIVALDDAVSVAHALEDFFVAVQEGRARIAPGHVDALLRAVDLLARLANGTAEAGESQAMLGELGDLERGPLVRSRPTSGRTADPSLLPVFKSELAENAAAIRNGLDARLALEAIAGSARLVRIEPLAAYAAAAARDAVPPPPAVIDALLALAACDDADFDEQLSRTIAALPQEPKPAPAPPPRREATAEQSKPSRREVRITAEKLDRLMAATGETTVAARWFDGFTRALGRLKQQYDALFDAINPQQWPELHGQAAECRAAMAERLEECLTFSRQMESIAGRLDREILATRMRPFSAGVHPFPRLVRDLCRQLGKKAELQISGGSTEIDRDILEKLEAPLTHLLRNAVDHGIERPEDRVAARKPPDACIRIEASHHNGMLQIVVSDDGRGIDVERVRAAVAARGLAGADIVDKLSEAELLEFLFLPGFTTADRVTEVSGRGVGLDAVQAMVRDVGGIVRVASHPGRGTTFTLQMAITRSVVRALLVEIAGEPYAVPLTRIEHALVVPRSDVHLAENREYVRFDATNVGLISARQLLGLENAPAGGDVSVLILNDRRKRYGLAVDRFTGESDLVLRRLDPRLGKVPNISAVSMTLDGTPILLFDVDDLVAAIDEIVDRGRPERLLAAMAQDAIIPIRRKRVLVVDDSLTVREFARRILETSGYEVELAVDGMHGWNAVRSSAFDLVISDIDMPRMDGIELLANIKGDERLSGIPVMIVSYKDRDEDRARGLDAGADRYLAKGSLADETMLRAVAELIGAAQ